MARKEEVKQIFHLVNGEGWSNQRGSEAWKWPKMREIMGYLKEIAMEVPGRAGKTFKYSNTKIRGRSWGWNSSVFRTKMSRAWGPITKFSDHRMIEVHGGRSLLVSSFKWG